jgi:hypothetical protein
MMKRHVMVAGLLCGWLGVTTCALGQQPQPAKSPEEAFRFAKVATAKGDWKGFVSYLAPETVDQLAGFMLVIGAVARDVLQPPPGPGFPKEVMQGLKEPVGKLFTKYGLSDETLNKMKADNALPNLSAPPNPDQLTKLANMIRDRANFTGEAMALIFPEIAKKSPKGADPLANKSLKDVQVNGNKATGKLVNLVNGMEVGVPQPIEFEQVNGNWVMEMPLFGVKKVAPPKKVNEI